MAQGTLLMAEVAALVMIAAVLTAAAVSPRVRLRLAVWAKATRELAPGTRASPTSTRASAPVTVFCPRTSEPRGVLIAAVGDGDLGLAILHCECFGVGSVTCGQECLPAFARA